MVAAMVPPLPAWCFAAGGPLPLHPPAADLFRPSRVLQVEDHDDGADIALLLRGTVGVAAIKGETVHTHPDKLAFDHNLLAQHLGGFQVESDHGIRSFTLLETRLRSITCNLASGIGTIG
jgi:hypothetical protein